ncbi:PP2C family protein-serine/threonine phosphatase [Streptomyces sodiiphilus]|uniref:PP2C family protein-serine/threonine phosphatase n=1 Tax=Streptomyces sodiiphilus TaxID=226217 RepID=A0ABN2NU98_9ACTN
MDVSPRSGNMLGRLLLDSHLLTLEQLPQRLAERAAEGGFTDARIYLCDLQQTVLRLLTGAGEDGRRETSGEETELRIDGTVAGRAFQHGRIQPVPLPGGRSGYHWWVPLLDGTERLGMLRVTTGDDADRTREQVQCLAALVALIVVAKTGHSDAHARMIRTRPMSPAAEMQWNLMPPRTFADARVVISAMLEPAYQLGGDAFDYSTSGDILHLAVFDAMGHDTTAGLTANLAVAACRAHRRRGADLAETAEAIENTLVAQLGPMRFATAVLADLDTRTGVITWVNHGHHPPVLIRGGRVTGELACPPAPPLGTDLGLPPVPCSRRLEPGDRLLFYTDGLIEARDASGQEFGLERFTDFVVRQHADGLSAPETLRRLLRSVVEYHQGRLEDDATVLLVEWHGNAPFAPGEVEMLTGLPEQ